MEMETHQIIPVPLSQAEHAKFARLLIRACGGLEQAEENCRISRSRLSEACSPTSGVYLAADVIAALEFYCGKAVYSSRLVSQLGQASGKVSPMMAACAVTEAAAALQTFMRQALLDGKISHRENERLIELERDLADAVSLERSARLALVAGLGPHD